MKRLLPLACILLSLTSLLSAQSFTPITTNITAVGESTVSWADIDQDLDADIIVSGITPSGKKKTLVFLNNQGSFDLQQSLTGMAWSSSGWADYDLDGDYDLILNGKANTDTTILYDNIDGILSPSSIELPPSGGMGSVAWCDFNLDGFPDLLLTGHWNTQLLINNQGTHFTTANVVLPPLNNSSGQWADYDNDGDDDLLLMGDNGSGPITLLYRNDAGTLIQQTTSLPHLMSGEATWCDVDSNGYPDLLLTGFDETLEPKVSLMMNHQGIFTDSGQYIPDVAISSAHWSDYDGDGDPDLLISGKCPGCGTVNSNIYTNNNGQLSMLTTAPLQGLHRGQVQWADYDNDGDPDALISGMTLSSEPITQLYQNNRGNNLYTSNTPPQPPTQLSSTQSNNSILLIWQRGHDNETPSLSLTYNIWLGNTPTTPDIIAPLANITTGFHYIISEGNNGQDTLSIINNLPPGTYYWGVQAIDQAYCGSTFATASFTITPTALTQHDLPSLRITSNTLSVANTTQPVSVTLHNMTGQCIVHSVINPHQTIDLASWSPGIYLATIKTSFGTFRNKIVHP